MEGQRSSLLVVGTELIQLHAAQDIKRQNDLKKRMNKITDTWRNGYLADWIGLVSHHTQPPLPLLLLISIHAFANCIG